MYFSETVSSAASNEAHQNHCSVESIEKRHLSSKNCHYEAPLQAAATILFSAAKKIGLNVFSDIAEAISYCPLLRH